MLIFRDRSLSVSRQSARFEILGEYQRLLDISDDGISHLSSTGLVLTSRSGRWQGLKPRRERGESDESERTPPSRLHLSGLSSAHHSPICTPSLPLSLSLPPPPSFSLPHRNLLLCILPVFHSTKWWNLDRGTGGEGGGGGGRIGRKGKFLRGRRGLPRILLRWRTPTLAWLAFTGWQQSTSSSSESRAKRRSLRGRNTRG